MEKQSGKIWKNLAVIVFVVSLPFAVLLQVSSEFGNAGIVINLILGFGLGIFLAAKITGALTDQQGKWKVAAAFLAALYTSYNYTMQGNGVYLLSQHLDIVEKLSPVRVTSIIPGNLFSDILCDCTDIAVCEKVSWDIR